MRKAKPGQRTKKARKGDWISLRRKMRVECCRCSLAHDIEVRVHKTLGPQWRATPINKQDGGT